MENNNLLKSYKQVNEDLRNQLTETKRKSLEWESIARRLLYYGKQSAAFSEFDINWFTNEILELQGTITKETNPNNKI